MEVTLLYFDGCPPRQVADERLRKLAEDIGFDLSHREVDTPEEAEALPFRGSPTILVDGRDPLAQGGDPVGLACRSYQTPDGRAGAPTVEPLRKVLR